MILRVILQFKDTNKALTSLSGPEPLYDPDYTGNHIVIFENQLTLPNQMALIDHTELQFINLRKLNFKNWRIVDIDHYMKGNSYFNRHATEREFHENVQKHMILEEDKPQG